MTEEEDLKEGVPGMWEGEASSEKCGRGHQLVLLHAQVSTAQKGRMRPMTDAARFHLHSSFKFYQQELDTQVSGFPESA